MLWGEENSIKQALKKKQRDLFLFLQPFSFSKGIFSREIQIVRQRNLAGGKKL